MSQNVYPSKTTLTLNKLVQDFIYNNFGSKADKVKIESNPTFIFPSSPCGNGKFPRSNATGQWIR